MNKYIALFIGLLCLFSLDALAQKERKFIRKGNGLFEGNEYENSEVEYRKALDKKINSYEAGFNLGDALYKQKKYDEALKQFQTLTVAEQDPKKLGEIYHNIGNTLLMNRKIDESIEAYKESLRNFPNSKETKYNLEYARKMKQKEEEEKKKQDQNKDQDKKNQDKKDQDKKDQDKKDQDKKDQKDQKDQKNKPEDQDKKKGDPEEQQNKISEQDAKRLLEALENDEKKVQEKVQKAKAVAQKAKRTKIKKDW
ncbi:tetratricopeptide repeat protein [Labilibaculum sp.]|uniref:tetratricopeptide repeat protein n=1 Tax=Labilibaculum sp. TaxID=2060723 RepID=UPI002AA5FE5F|nr:tetratricopeptide repeat protein [Labilibaculum sp.]